MKRFALHFRDLIDDVASRNSLEKVGITASLDKKDSPSSERWCRYTCGVLTSSSNGAPLDNGLLQSSW